MSSSVRDITESTEAEGRDDTHQCDDWRRAPRSKPERRAAMTDNIFWGWGLPIYGHSPYR